MGKKAIILFLAAGLVSGAAFGEGKFKSGPGVVILGGEISVTELQGFSSNAVSFLSLRVRPSFGEFLTKDTLLFTFCNFEFNIDFNSMAWQGGLDIGAQGRYFFSTDAAVNFFLGLEVAVGLKLQPDYNNLQEHLLTGIVIGLFVPFNEKMGLDFSCGPIFYLPLNNYQPFAIITSLSAGIIAAL